MDTSEKITSLRQAFSLSQEEFGARIGVSRQTVVSWEQGTRPSSFNRRRICEEFALPVNFFDADVTVSFGHSARAEEREGEHAAPSSAVLPAVASSAVLPEAPDGALLQEAPSAVLPKAEQEAGGAVPLPPAAGRAASALRALGTAMRWGTVVFAGLLAMCVAAGVVLLVLSLVCEGSDGCIVAVNPRGIAVAMMTLSGVIAAFYALCLFLRLLLREVLRGGVRRK